MNAPASAFRIPVGRSPARLRFGKTSRTVYEGKVTPSLVLSGTGAGRHEPGVDDHAAAPFLAGLRIIRTGRGGKLGR